MSSEFFRLALFALMAAIVWLQLGRDHQTHVTRHHLRVRLLQIYAGHEWLCIGIGIAVLGSMIAVLTETALHHGN